MNETQTTREMQTRRDRERERGGRIEKVEKRQEGKEGRMGKDGRGCERRREMRFSTAVLTLLQRSLISDYPDV